MFFKLCKWTFWGCLYLHFPNVSRNSRKPPKAKSSGGWYGKKRIYLKHFLHHNSPISQYINIHTYCSLNFIFLVNYIENCLINLSRRSTGKLNNVTQKIWRSIISTEEKCNQFNLCFRYGNHWLRRNIFLEGTVLIYNGSTNLRHVKTDIINLISIVL